MPIAKMPRADVLRKPIAQAPRNEPKKIPASSSKNPKVSSGTSVLVTDVLKNKQVPFWGPPWDHYNPVAWVTSQKGRNLLATLRDKKAMEGSGSTSRVSR